MSMLLPEKRTILFEMVYEGKAFRVQTVPEEHSSLMALISEQLPVSGFGICYGGGSCGTCGVEIKDPHAGERKFTLSCEIPIDDELAGKTVTLL
jgi:ferredoxin